MDPGSSSVKRRGILPGSALGMFRIPPDGKSSKFGVFGVGRPFLEALRKCTGIVSSANSYKLP